MQRRWSDLGEEETPGHRRSSNQVVMEMVTGGRERATTNPDQRRGSDAGDEERRGHRRSSSQVVVEMVPGARERAPSNLHERRGSDLGLGDEERLGRRRSSSQVMVEMAPGVRERAPTNPDQAYPQDRQQQVEEEQGLPRISPPTPYGGDYEEEEVLSPSRITLADRPAFNNPYAAVQVSRGRGHAITSAHESSLLGLLRL